MSVVVRSAPSPTGFLHIGTARTTLFNYLFAKHHGGKFLLRIEDTDRQRSTQEAVDVIFESLAWLGIPYDDEPIFQFARAGRHREIAQLLVAQGKAYYCYCTPEELELMKAEATTKGLPPRYNGFWRDRDPELAPIGVKPVVRLKMPQEGSTVIHDLVQGTVEVANTQLDDMVLLRSDGTPTYMLSVVVDDHDMKITHIVRGDDHLTNAFRQYQIYKAMDWNVPEFAHIPLIYGSDGTKLSKRHGATATNDYKTMGILPDAMFNYLLRLGWAHGNDEIISRDEAIQWFDLNGVGKSPSRFDMQKLLSLNAHYLRKINDHDLIKTFHHVQDPFTQRRILKGMKSLKERAKTLVELHENARFYESAPTEVFEKPSYFETLFTQIKNIETFTKEDIEALFRSFAKEHQLKLADLAHHVRLHLTGKTVSPSIFEIMEILGKEETLKRCDI